MRLVLNGEVKEFDAPLSLQTLLDQLRIQPGRVACEVNTRIIKRALYPETALKEGDAIEIIQAIGGG